MRPSRTIRSPSPPSPPPDKILESYDVFLNFRGVDLRRNFTELLYSKLRRYKDIVVFRDDKKLPKGEELDTLYTVIERSSISVILFSKNYATSKWCLDELVKIVECVANTKRRHVAMPVFFHVSTDDVAMKSGRYAKDIKKLAKKHEPAKVEGWIAALRKASKLAGWPHAENQSDDALATDIWYTIVRRLRLIHGEPEPKTQELVRFTPKAKNSLYSYQELEDTAVIRICGSYGCGSANSAKLIYDNVLARTGSNRNGPKPSTTQPVDPGLTWSPQMWHVDGGINALWKTHAKDEKKVLMIVEDMEKLRDLVYFAKWNGYFGPGSRFVVSTVDSSKKVLEVVHINLERAASGNQSYVGYNNYVDVACFVDGGGGGDKIMLEVQSLLADAPLPADIVMTFNIYKWELNGVVPANQIAMHLDQVIINELIISHSFIYLLNQSNETIDQVTKSF
ncbi:Disease resistance protein RUN1 [Linum perenne]